jgi:hypothetical protein
MMHYSLVLIFLWKEHVEYLIDNQWSLSFSINVWSMVLVSQFSNRYVLPPFQ